MMITYKIRWNMSATKEIQKIQKNDRKKILEAIEALTENPFHRGVRKVVNMENAYRIRVGRYRVVYSVFEKLLVLEIIRVRHRRKAYRV